MNIVGNRTLYGELRRHAARKGDEPWFTFEDETGRTQQWSWAGFLASVQQTSRVLVDCGLRENDVVAVALRNHPLFVRLVLAGSQVGVTVLPINPAAPPDEMRYFLEHAGARLAVADAEGLEAMRRAATGCQNVQEVWARDDFDAHVGRQATDELATSTAGGGVVQLLYTSGTTSRPKGVMLTDANFLYGSEVFRGATGLREDDHHFIALPLFHAAAQCHALWPSLVAGCRVTLAARFSASRFFAQAAHHGATMAALFGAPLRMLLNQPERPGDRAHRIRNITFAQSLTDEQYARWQVRFGAALQQLWGMTETCSLPVMSPLYGERRLAAMGRPVVGYEVRVVDADGREVPAGELGELIVRGQPGLSLMRGYLHNPEATARALRQVDGATWMFSGDTVRADEDGFLYFVDRGKDLIKRAGENISCTEVEAVLAQHPAVREVCVAGVPDPVRDETVGAALILHPGATLDASALRTWCAGRLVSFKVPERIVFAEDFPRTSVGKVQRHLVRQQLLIS